MADFGAPVAQNVQAPNVIGSISGLLDLKSKQQGLQSQGLQIQQQQQNLQKGAAETQMTQQSAQQRQGIAGIDWHKYNDSDGMISTDKMLSDPTLRQAAGDQFLQVMQQAAGVRIQQVQAKDSLAGLNGTLRGQFGQALGALRTDPDVVADTPAGRAKVNAAAAQFAESGGPDAARVAQTYAQQIEHVPPGQLVRAISTAQLQAQAADRQAASQAPSYADTGNTQPQINPQAAGGALGVQGSLPGGGFVRGLPPTQPTVVNTPQGPVPGVIGPHAGNSAPQPGDTPEGLAEQIREVQSNGGQPITPDIKPAIDREVARLQTKLQGMQKPSGFVPTGLPAGQAGNIENNFNEMNRHFSGLQDAAAGSQLISGLVGNVKALVPGAIIGTESGRKAYLNGLLNAVGIGSKATGDTQTDTDLLQKQLAQMQLSTPATTDAMRTLVEAARPHGTMNAGAINEAVDQLAGQVKANVAQRNVLSGYKMMGDAQGYQQARQKIEQVADPRAWQYEALGPGTPAAKEFVSKLTPADREQLGKKIQALHDMGLLQ